MQFKVGEKYTIIRINDLAMTVKREITVVGALESGIYKYKPRGRRSVYIGEFKVPDTLVFDGWDIPVRADTDCAGAWRGNACLNLIGDADTVKYYVDFKNLNVDSQKGKILLVDPQDDSDRAVTVLYPDEARKLDHAVINRYMEQEVKK